MNWLFYAFRNVVRNRRRSFTSILIVAIGTLSVLVGGGFALFTYESLREQAARDSGHVIIAHPDYFEYEEETPMAFGLAQHESLRRSLEQDERVRVALPRLQFSGLISNGDKSTIFMGTGVDAKNEFKVRGPFFKMVSGSTLSSHPPEAQDPEVLIGTGLARSLKAKVGDSLTLLSTNVDGGLNAVDAQVKGIFTVGVPETDKRILLTTLSTAQDLLLTDRVSTLSVYLWKTELTDILRQEIAQNHPGLSYRTWLDQAFFYLKVRGLYNRIFGMMGLLILCMVFISVANVVSTSVIERTREIGTLRAMGSLPGQIIRNFALEAAIVGFIGTLLGMLLALSAWLFLQYAGIQMPPPPGRSAPYPLLISLSAPLWITTGLTILALSITAALVASRKAVKKSIVEALTHV